VVHRYYLLERGSVILQGVPSDEEALPRALAV
jgi:hypothetical protein